MAISDRFDWNGIRVMLATLTKPTDDGGDPFAGTTDPTVVEYVLREILANLLAEVEALRPQIDPLVAVVIRERFTPAEQELLSSFLLGKSASLAPLPL